MAKERYAKMTTVYHTDEDGNIIVLFDTRWRFPETLGYTPDDPQYKDLQRMWERATGCRVADHEDQALEKLEQKGSLEIEKLEQRGRGKEGGECRVTNCRERGG